MIALQSVKPGFWAIAKLPMIGKTTGRSASEKGDEVDIRLPEP